MYDKYCGICLNRSVKLYSSHVFNLRLYYKDVIPQEMQGLIPRYFCFTCAALLNKYHKFKEKCQAGQKVVREILKNGPISLRAIAEVNREENKLTYSYGILRETERVKTFVAVDNIANDLEEIESLDKNDNDIGIDIELENDGINNVIVQEKPNSCNETIENDTENINILRQSVLNDHTYLSNNEQSSDIKRETVQVPHIVKKSADSKNLRVLVVGEIRTKNVGKEIKSVPKTKKFLFQNHKLPEKMIGNNDQKYKLQLNSEHWKVINMSEKQAMDEFQSKAKKSKYLSAKYKCDKCYSSFSTKLIMNRHMKLIHSESRGPYECKFCHRRYKLNCVLRHHIAVHYTKFKCLRCNTNFQMGYSVQNHDESHNGLLRKCQHCDLEFRHKSTYYSHLRIYHRSEHVCKICGASFVSDKGLQQHKKLTHLSSDYNEDILNENTYCKRCDIKFTTVKGYVDHFNESVNHAEDQTVLEGDDESKAPASKLAPLKGGATKLFERNTAKTTTCLVVQPWSQADSPPVTTAVAIQSKRQAKIKCKKLFPSYSRYLVHHRKEHKDVPVPKYTQLCEICGRNYKTKTIATHMNVHTREKTYTCSTCGAHFYHLTSLTRHMKIHTGERPFKCPLCEKRFTQKVSMQIHHRTVHLKEPYPKRAKRRRIVKT